MQSNSVRKQNLNIEEKNKEDYTRKLKFCILSCCKSQLSKDYLKVFSLE